MFVIRGNNAGCLAFIVWLGFAMTFEGNASTAVPTDDEWPSEWFKLCSIKNMRLGEICCRSEYEKRWPESPRRVFGLVKSQIDSGQLHADSTNECFDVGCGHPKCTPSNCSYLYLAVRLGQVDFVNYLLEKGANVNATCSDYASPLLAVQWHQNAGRLQTTYDIVKSLVRFGANADAQDEKTGDTTLHNAVRYAVKLDDYSPYTPRITPPSLFDESFDVVSTILQHGASPSMKNFDGDTPLHLAICLVSTEQSCNGNHLVVKLLLDHGADILAKNNNNHTSLHIAAINCDLRSMRLLVQNGADVTARLPNNRTAFQMFSCRDDRLRKLLQNYPNNATGQVHYEKGLEYYFRFSTDYLELFRVRYWFTQYYLEGASLLVRRGADPNTKNYYGDTFLPLAILEANYTAVDFLLKHGADVNIRHGIHSWTPLFLAACINNISLASKLLDRGADVNAQLYGRYEGTTVLHVNVYGDRMMRLFLDAGADVNARQEDGSTPLHVAVEVFNPDVVRLLLLRGADVNAISNDGWTPLLKAARHGYNNTAYDEIAKILLDNGADVNIQKDDKTALLFAAGNCNRKMAKLLTDYGADVKASLVDGTTALHLSFCMIGIAKQLLDAGADINAKKDDGKTPLHIALQNEFSDRKYLVQFLLSRGADPNAKDNDGLAPYASLAVSSNAPPSTACDLLKLLLKYGVSIHDLRNSTTLPLTLIHGDLHCDRQTHEAIADEEMDYPRISRTSHRKNPRGLRTDGLRY